MEALTFLFYPFLGCVLLILIHAYFGIHILERGIIFVDLAMAQFIALGIALAFLLGHEGSARGITTRSPSRSSGPPFFPWPGGSSGSSTWRRSSGCSTSFPWRAAS